MKICSICKKDLPYDYYYKDLGNKDGLSYHCKSCHNEKTKAYRAKNKIKNTENKDKVIYVNFKTKKVS